MIIPIRCFTCNRVLASKYKTYLEIISDDLSVKENIISGDPNINLDKETPQQKAFKIVGVDDRYCCKRHLVSHVDIIDKI